MPSNRNPLRGFSLIELLVATAIIGILAVLAAPRYQNFRARAVQTQAKGDLSAAFIVQKSFFGEHSTYHGHLAALGYVPQDMGENWDPNLISWAAPNSKRYYAVWAVHNCSDLADGNFPVPLTSLGLVAPNYVVTGTEGFYGGYMSSKNLCEAFSDSCVHVLEPYGVSQSSFIIQAMGCPTENHDDYWSGDMWTINEKGQLTSKNPG